MAKAHRKHHHDEDHEEHVNHEAWVIPYADVLTLLMALFLVLFALGQPDEEKMDLAAQSFRKELNSGFLGFGAGDGGAGPLAAGGASVLDGAGPKPAESNGEENGTGAPEPDDGAIIPPPVLLSPDTPPDETTPTIPPDDGDDDGDDGDDGDDTPTSTEIAVETVHDPLGDPLGYVEQIVHDRAVSTGLTTAIGFRRESRGLVVTIITDRVLFAPGEANIEPDGYEILEVVADALMEVPNHVMIEGHTDSRPISTPRYPSNWELSTARATSVLRYLVEERGFPGDRASAAGYADTHPVDDGTSPSAMARNRRVEIVVLATA